MAMLGCRLVDLNDPRELDQIKKLIVFVEMDRCTADAVAHVTGVRLGRRSLKFVDYGIMAATFLNLESGIAYRVLSTEEARDLVHSFASDIEGVTARQLEAYKRMPESTLFKVQRVDVRIEDCDLPGPTRHKAVCNRCGQVVRDRREILIDDEILCRPCSDSCYFSNPRDVSWPGMNRSAEKDLADKTERTPPPHTKTEFSAG